MSGFAISAAPVASPKAPTGLGMTPLRREPAAPAPLHRPDRLEQGVTSARTAAGIGETTLRLLQQKGLKVEPKTTPVTWLTVAGFADGAALSTDDPKLQAACMLAGHYGGYKFGLAAPLVSPTESLIAVCGVTAAAIVPQLTTEALSDPMQVLSDMAPNHKARSRAGLVGGSVGGGLAMATLLTHPNLLKPQAAIPLVAFGAASGYLDGVAAVTNQRKEQAVSTGLGHVTGFAMTTMVPGMALAAKGGTTRAGLAAVALAPFVVASIDARRHPIAD